MLFFAHWMQSMYNSHIQWQLQKVKPMLLDWFTTSQTSVGFSSCQADGKIDMLRLEQCLTYSGYSYQSQCFSLFFCLWSKLQCAWGVKQDKSLFWCNSKNLTSDIWHDWWLLGLDIGWVQFSHRHYPAIKASTEVQVQAQRVIAERMWIL